MNVDMPLKTKKNKRNNCSTKPTWGYRIYVISCVVFKEFRETSFARLVTWSVNRMLLAARLVPCQLTSWHSRQSLNHDMPESGVRVSAAGVGRPNVVPLSCFFCSTAGKVVGGCRVFLPLGGAYSATRMPLIIGRIVYASNVQH